MNIFDFNLEYSLFDVIISITLFVISFIVFVYFGYFRDMKERDKENYKIKDMLIEGYFHKFDEYNNIISDLRAKIDLIELKIGQKGENIYDQSKVASSNDIVNNESQRSASHVISPVTKSVIITEKKDDVKVGDFGLRLNTTDSILKMLEVPLTSREIQRRIKKSREHTSRLLKKLYSENIVMRDESTRPFKYKITNEGRKLLEQTTSSSG
jgi:DNA-binding transcriptional ArsR family regulator